MLRGIASTLPLLGCALLAACGGKGATAASPPAVSLSLNPSVVAAGQPVVVTWSAANATSCAASGAWSGPRAVSGDETLSPLTPGSYSYSLTCTGTGGSADRAAVLTVTAAIEVSLDPPAAFLATSATRQFTATVLNGANAVVTWSVDGIAGGDGVKGTVSSTGLYRAPAAVPNPPTVAVTATSVADQTKSASAAVTVDATLAVVLGAGASGSPAAGATTAPPAAVPYSYVAANGYSAATVELDGVIVPPAGTIPMNADHWLWAFGQPATGTDFADFIAVPADPVVVPYPRFYSQQPTTVRVTDPYCATSSEVVAYPGSYRGSFALPKVSGAPLPAATKRGVSLFDDPWDALLQNATYNQGCSASLHEALAATVARARRLGADHIAVSAFSFLLDASSATPAFDLDHPQLSGAELAFIAQTAKAAGLDLWLWVAVPSGDKQGVALPRAPDQAWMQAFLAAYADLITQTATTAEQSGVSVMMLNWKDYWLDWTSYRDLYATQMSSALSRVRKVYGGKLMHFDFQGLTDVNACSGGWGSGEATCTFQPATPAVAALFGGVDAFMFEPGAQPVTAAQDQSLDLHTLKGLYKDLIRTTAQRYAPFAKPLVADAFAQSTRDWFTRGWREPAFCTNSTGGFEPDLARCYQGTLQTDFSVQALGYEAMLEAITEATAETGASLMSFDTEGYWWTDVMIPQAAFPNISQSVRNKPAEVILQRWFSH